MKAINKLFGLFIGFCFILYFIAILIGALKYRVFDIPIHDTYFVIPQNYIVLPYLFLLLFSYLIYRFRKNYLLEKKWLVIAHVFSAMLFTVIFLNLFLRIFGLQGISRRYYAFDVYETEGIRWLVIMVGIGILSQLFFIVNLAGGIIKNWIKKLRN